MCANSYSFRLQESRLFIRHAPKACDLARDFPSLSFKAENRGSRPIGVWMEEGTILQILKPWPNIKYDEIAQVPDGPKHSAEMGE